MRFFNSVKALYSAVGMLSLVFVLGYYLDMQSDVMNARHLEISLELERMIRLDQELTGMLSLAVVERNALRVTRYDTVRHDVEASIMKVADLTNDRSIKQEISALSESHKIISDYEITALNLMKSDKWKEAGDILFGDGYLRAKKTYEIDSEAIPGIVLGEIEGIEKRFYKIKSAALAARIAAICLLLWTGILFSRRARADLAEQVRLRMEISDAKEVLEARVLERTREAETALHKIKAMSQAVVDALVMINSQGTVQFWNHGAEKLFGYTSEEAMGRNFHEMAVPPEHQEKVRTGMGRFAATGHGIVFGDTIQATAINLIGQAFPVEVSISPFQVDGEWFSVGTVRDITEQKKAQDALRESEEFLNAVINNSTALIYVKDINGRYMLTNKMWNDIIDIPRQDVIGKTDHDIFPQDMADSYRNNDLRALGPGKMVQDEESVMVKGEKRTFISVRFPILGADDSPRATCGISTDITELKKAEKVILESERQHRTIFESSPLGIIHMSIDGTIMNCNEKFVELMGSSREKLIGFNSMKQGRDAAMKAALQKALAGETSEYESEYTSATGGKTVPLHMKFNPVNSGQNPTEVIVTLEDITTRKHAEKELKVKMEELERFSRLTINREEKMIQLKEAINLLLEQTGREKKYKIVD